MRLRPERANSVRRRHRSSGMGKRKRYFSPATERRTIWTTSRDINRDIRCSRAAQKLAVFRRGGAEVRLRHRTVIERFVERLLVDARLARDLAQRAAGARSLLDDLRRLVVPDIGVERGRRRERQLRVALGILTVRLDSLNALLVQE